MKMGKKLHIFLIFLAGVLISVMLVLMRLGGSINFEEFMSAGRVYDVEPSKLTKNSKGWQYDRENERHLLLSDRAGIRFSPGGRQKKWSFIYLTVGQLSRAPSYGMLKFYDAHNTELFEQPITLNLGRNMIQLEDTVTPFKSVRIVILDAQGEYIAVTDMQFRTTPSWFTVPHFLELFAVALAASLALLAVLDVLFHIFCKKSSVQEAYKPDWLIDGIQDGIRIFGDFLGGRIGGKLYSYHREALRKFLFSLLFVWMMAGNVMGWIYDVQIYRYYVLLCVLLLLAISLVSWEKPLQNHSWQNTLIKSFLTLWIGVLICDFFVNRKLEPATAIAMLFAGSVFAYFWQNMEKPEKMLSDLMEGLEFTFFLAVIYCIVFRVKQPAVDYNGMFLSPEQLAMYAALMAIVFLTEMDQLIEDRIAAADLQSGENTKEGVFFACVKNIAGGALSLFFVLRSGHMLGIAVFVLIGIFYLPNLLKKMYRMLKKCRILFLQIIISAVLAYMCVFVVFVGTKYFPEILGMDTKYENELLLTRLKGEQKEIYELCFPNDLDGVLTKEVEKLPIIWRNYARRLNLFGHGGKLEVFGRENLPYNGYLDMAYHHGIFILLPYVAFQITVIALGIKCAFRKKRKRNVFLLFLGIAYLCFSFGSNVELSWGHPMWLCFYLSAGYPVKIEAEENLGKEEVI